MTPASMLNRAVVGCDGARGAIKAVVVDRNPHPNVVVKNRTDLIIIIVVVVVAEIGVDSQRLCDSVSVCVCVCAKQRDRDRGRR